MTTPDPRTDLAGYLGLTDGQAEQCRLFADAEGSISAKLGARLIEQDQARADEPDDGQHAMLDIDALGGPKMLRETMCVAQGAVLREGHAGARLHADRISSIIDAVVHVGYPFVYAGTRDRCGKPMSRRTTPVVSIEEDTDG